MIKEKTVFILGAGASVPYGYPTGAELRLEICDEHPDRLEKCIAKGIDTAMITRNIQQAKSLAEKFEKSSTESIDLFLARNREFSETGKLAIVLTLLHYEKESKFRERVSIPKQDWYSHLFTKMTESLTEPDGYKNFGGNNISFITFNYDRSLEYILHESLKYSFLLAKDSEIVEQLREITISHVYGKIDDLPWEKPGSTSYLNAQTNYPLGTSHVHDYVKLMENIQTIHERKEKDRSEILKQISEATRVFFLGFGYAQENLEILEFKKALTEKHKVYGTAFGSSKKKIRDIERSLLFKKRGGGPHDSGKKFLPSIHDMDCRKLLEEYL